LKVGAATLTDRFTSEVGKTKAMRLVDRTMVEEILTEQGFQQSGCTSDKCAVEVGAMLGQNVKTFNMQSTPAGYHSITWDATNDLNQQVGAGVYLYQLQTKDFVKTRKMVLLK
jgi:flagellar hook assembly protein FlgD